MLKPSKVAAAIVQKHQEDRLNDAIAYTERLLNQAVALEAKGDKYGADHCLRTAIAAEAKAFG